MSETVVIVNPAASSGGAAAQWPGIEHALRQRFPELSVRETEAAGHATALCRQALESGATRIISVGGDGTNNEVLCGFVDEAGQNRFPDAVLGIVAAGTGGDFVRMFGALPPAKQVQRLGQAEVRRIDYGLAQFHDHEGREVRRPFLNTASVGISGLVVRYVATASRSLGNRWAYVGSSLRGIWNYRNRQVWISHDDEEPERVDLTLACITNGQYFGAGMWACPDASLTDGQLDSLRLVSMSRTRLVGTLAKVFKGRHLSVSGVHYRKAKSVLVRPVDPATELLLELDGEQPGRAPVRVGVVPGALNILVA